MTENEMPMRDAREDTRWKAYIFAGASVEFGMFTLIWVISGSVQAAAMVCFLLTYSIVLVGATALFMRSMHRHDVENIAAAIQQQQPPAIDANWTVRTPQLPAPGDDWHRVDNNVLLRQEQIEATAMKIYRRMYPHTQPTQTNVKELFPDIQSNGTISAVMDYLVKRGVADGGGAGSAYHWVDR